MANHDLSASIIVKNLGLCDYSSTWQQMHSFSRHRTATTIDEIWILQHHPVFTIGQAGSTRHLLQPGAIPVVRTDRGGQVTYHGPGQLILYLLLDMQRKNLSLRRVINSIQQAVITLLACYKVCGYGDPLRPGVYVDGGKICAFGLKVHKGCLYHGLALNVNMDLQPFQLINPCGQQDLAITQLVDLGIQDDLATVSQGLIKFFLQDLAYREV